MSGGEEGRRGTKEEERRRGEPQGWEEEDVCNELQVTDFEKTALADIFTGMFAITSPCSPQC